jgi:hypothetical protein
VAGWELEKNSLEGERMKAAQPLPLAIERCLQGDTAGAVLETETPTCHTAI